ncbi:hypothetical protein Rhe02_46970 [Rhizocola hellebori]|uniref:Uncharacterized protein n=1 Tax=Rhizocola hellebori TaxID=1392758 RepID=A0A8J3Q9W7_9ACTN|nr:DUF6082 family protein [Rhizocola hellebori]GIH06630.1 hypothetical protein Rhe02_46970 [Rhizocola hellebori]
MNTVDRITIAIGAVSAMVSALALVGIAFALRLQVRQTRISQRHTLHGLHIEVMRLHLENPLFRPVWGPVSAPVETEQWVRNVYRNIVFMYFQTLYILETISDDGVRLQVRSLLRSPEAQDWWRAARPFYKADALTKAQRRFYVLVEEEWERATASGSGEVEGFGGG